MLYAIAVCLVGVEKISEAKSGLNRKNAVINSVVWYGPRRENGGLHVTFAISR